MGRRPRQVVPSNEDRSEVGTKFKAVKAMVSHSPQHAVTSKIVRSSTILDDKL